MMTDNTPLPTTLRLVLSNEAGGGRVVVPLEAYIEFDETQSHRLEELVDRWAPFAAPGASRASLLRDRSSARP